MLCIILSYKDLKMPNQNAPYSPESFCLFVLHREWTQDCENSIQGTASLIIYLQCFWDNEDSSLWFWFQEVSNKVVWSLWDNTARVSTDISPVLYFPRGSALGELHV